VEPSSFNGRQKNEKVEPPLFNGRQKNEKVSHHYLMDGCLNKK
jgi:hypothetical protein